MKKGINGYSNKSMYAVAGRNGKIYFSPSKNSFSPGKKYFGNRTSTLHAEIIAASRISNPKRMTMYVCKADGKGTSMPCQMCIETLYKQGWRYVVFTINDRIIKMKVYTLYISGICTLSSAERIRTN